MSTLETLKAARKLITPRKNWIKHALAETQSGMDIDAWRPEACRWCSAGAIVAVCGAYSAEHHAAIDFLEKHIGEYIGVFNDSHKHKEVLRAFDEAIAKLESQPMTHAEAKRESIRRWGYRGFARIRYRTYGPRIYAVGIGTTTLGLSESGFAASWEAAFADAEERQKGFVR